MPATEAFPLLASPRGDYLTKSAGPKSNDNQRTARRRKSSGLGGEIRAGDTGVPALATLDVRQSSPATLRAERERYENKPFSKKRKARSLFRQWRRYALKNTWVSPLVVLLIFLGLYAINPTPLNPIHHFIFLSHEIPTEFVSGTETHYGKGRWDFAFVAFYTIVLSFTREFIMQTFLRPFSKYSGMRTRAKQSRFMEQMYTALYFGVTGPWGLYVMSRTSMWYFNTRAMYEGFPHKTSEGFFKFYYLFQASYWLQQAIVLLLGLEKPRKDYKELVWHHVVSLSLIGLSYRFHFTHMGLGVFITHDISDFFLATSKTLNYIDSPMVGPYFAIFIGAWVYFRHYLNLIILYSEFYEFKTVGPYELDWETEQYKCDISHWISTFLLSCLQGLNLFWLYHIIRIAYRFAVTKVGKDDRSDIDSEEEEERRAEEIRLSKVGLDKGASEKVMANVDVNGHGNGNGKTTAVDLTTNDITNRKEHRTEP
ncbi:TLC domain-containing protein [Calycina marina]|uniref:TLC domain-containing protein n=1 Tax=Calycina marina TaxID=1763456 RepID=A0A9P7Z104_9HELO|nr:TLC domain-containing protein [Calycina marina]